jgi:hypothetical protein
MLDKRQLYGPVRMMGLNGQTLSPFGAPLPRGLTSVAVYSRPNRRCLVLFIDIVAAVPDEGPSVTIGDHVCP